MLPFWSLPRRCSGSSPQERGTQFPLTPNRVHSLYWGRGGRGLRSPNALGVAVNQATADSHCPARHPVRAVAGCLWLHGHSWPVPGAEAKQKPEKANTPRSSPGSVTGGSRWGRARILVPSSGGDTAVSSVAFPRVLSGPQRWPARRSRAHRGCFLSERPTRRASRGHRLGPGPRPRLPFPEIPV